MTGNSQKNTPAHVQSPMRVSPANEDYLEAIVELERESGDGPGPTSGSGSAGLRSPKSAGTSVRSVDIAAKLDVTKASVNKAVGALKAAGLITQPPYGDITLTPEGRAYGEKVLERHYALKSFLMNSLGVDESTAEDEACRMEHTISDETMEKWVEFVKNANR